MLIRIVLTLLLPPSLLRCGEAGNPRSDLSSSSHPLASTLPSCLPWAANKRQGQIINPFCAVPGITHSWRGSSGRPLHFSVYSLTALCACLQVCTSESLFVPFSGQLPVCHHYLLKYMDTFMDWNTIWKLKEPGHGHHYQDFYLKSNPIQAWNKYRRVLNIFCQTLNIPKQLSLMFVLKWMLNERGLVTIPAEIFSAVCWNILWTMLCPAATVIEMTVRDLHCPLCGCNWKTRQ